MHTFLQMVFGIKEKTPEMQIQRIKELMGLKGPNSDFLDAKIKCPQGQDTIPIKALLKENKEFLLQVLDKEKKELDGEAKKELERIKELMKRIESL